MKPRRQQGPIKPACGDSPRPPRSPLLGLPNLLNPTCDNFTHRCGRVPCVQTPFPSLHMWALLRVPMSPLRPTHRRPACEMEFQYCGWPPALSSTSRHFLFDSPAIHTVQRKPLPVHTGALGLSAKLSGPQDIHTDAPLLWPSPRWEHRDAEALTRQDNAGNVSRWTPLLWTLWRLYLVFIPPFIQLEWLCRRHSNIYIYIYRARNMF